MTLASLRLARQETGAARIGQHVYVVGGLRANGAATATVEAYLIAEDRWVDVVAMPAPRDHAAVAAAGGKLYVAGGFAGDFVAKDTLFVYDPALNAWSSGATLPDERGGSWAVGFGGKLYVFGGVDRFGVARRETFVYDPATGNWSQGANMPTAREHLNAAVLGDFAYVIGGRAAGSGSSDANERYHPASNTWEVLEDLPTARSAMALAAIDGRIHAMGGEVPQLFDLHEIYDPGTDSWSLGPAMAVPRHGVPAVPLADRILVPGGGTVQGLDPTVHVDSFVPERVAPPCEPDAATLCLNGGRFAVTVEWIDPPTGSSRRAVAHEQLDETGIFSFFDEQNFELLVKVLDGRDINGAFWVFFGALSDVEYTVTVIDTDTGAMRDYHNPPGRFASVADIDAFPSAEGGVRAPRELGLASLARVATNSGALGSACVEDDTTLCFQGGRFAADVSWRPPAGSFSDARVLEQARTDQSGLFFFFDEGNVELALKVLDGRAINGKFWVFFGALSDLEYTITVTDTATGAVREYHNPQGQLASRADIDAFEAP